MGCSRRTLRPTRRSSSCWPKVEKERELKLGAEERLMALEKRASLDAAAVARLRKEQGELLQIAERLRSEHGAASEECD